MTEQIKKTVWAIWAKSSTEDVDVGIAAAMLMQDVRDGIAEGITLEDVTAAEKWARDNYKAICDAWKVKDISLLDNIR